jgi:hypothetical protein
MAPSIYQGELPKYDGPFSWKDSTSQAKIKNIMLDYDCNNPRTWPLVTANLRMMTHPAYDF